MVCYCKGRKCTFLRKIEEDKATLKKPPTEMSDLTDIGPTDINLKNKTQNSIISTDLLELIMQVVMVVTPPPPLSSEHDLLCSFINKEQVPFPHSSLNSKTGNGEVYRGRHR